MTYSTYKKFHAAPLVLRSGGRRDYFVYFTILLGLMLAAFGLLHGAPPLPGAEAAGVAAVVGP